MKTVWKYQLKFGDEDTELKVPATRKPRIVHFALQGKTPTVWIEVETEATEKMLRLNIVGTGWEIPATTPQHQGTVIDRGLFVWHLYSSI